MGPLPSHARQLLPGQRGTAAAMGLCCLAGMLAWAVGTPVAAQETSAVSWRVTDALPLAEAEGGPVGDELYLAWLPGTVPPRGVLCADLANGSKEPRQVTLRLLDDRGAALSQRQFALPGNSRVAALAGEVPLAALAGRASTVLVPAAVPLVHACLVGGPGEGTEHPGVLRLAPSAWCEPLAVEVANPWTRETAARRNRLLTITVLAAIPPDTLAAGRLELALQDRSTGREMWYETIPSPRRRSTILLPTDGLEADAYALRAVWRDAAGADQATAETMALVLPGDDRRLRVLNNLVTELLRLEGEACRTVAETWFVTPRDGWCFFRLRGRGLLRVDDDRRDIANTLDVDGPSEGMCRLPAGRHRLWVQGTPDAITVRSVPALVCAGPEIRTAIPSLGPHTWERIRQALLPHCNVVAGDGTGSAAAMREVSEAGKTWVSPAALPARWATAGLTPDQAMAWSRGAQGYSHPLAGGIRVEGLAEGPVESAYIALAGSARQLADEEPFRGRMLLPLVAASPEAPGAALFLRCLRDCGWPFALDCPVSEGPTEAEGMQAIQTGLVARCQNWEEALPGSLRRAVIALSAAMTPPAMANTCPGTDFGVHLDAQMHALAVDPLFFGLYGVEMSHLSRADSETLRRLGRLLRHYAIEGSTERLAADPYTTTHLDNPDFEQGLEGWTVTAAGHDSICPIEVPGLGLVQGRQAPSPRGDTAVLLRVTAAGANRLEQDIVDLAEGRVYSVRMLAAECGALVGMPPDRDLTGATITVSGAEMLPGAIRESYPTALRSGVSPGPGTVWMEYHCLRFRARGPSARLRITDRGEGTREPALEGTEILINGIEVQPCLEE
ncbi:MAG: hypothetical protein JXR77_08780 [Lentisphaeria bacterium]|nr:hypothetical protein [Lentisphaeria bacterium]